nr:protein GPR15L isoform X2 [Equus caballus]
MGKTVRKESSLEAGFPAPNGTGGAPVKCPLARVGQQGVLNWLPGTGTRPRPRPKHGKVRPCCPPGGTPVQVNPKGRPSKICRPCKFKPEAPWVVPGALPQV